MTASGSKPWPPEAPHSHPRWLPVPPQPHTTLELPQGLLGRPYRVHRFGPVEPAQGTLPLLPPPHKAGWPRASSWRSPVLRRTYGQGSSLLAVLPGQQQPTRGEMPLYDRPQHRSLPGSRSPRGFGRPHCPPSLLAEVGDVHLAPCSLISAMVSRISSRSECLSKRSSPVFSSRSRSAGRDFGSPISPNAKTHQYLTPASLSSKCLSRISTDSLLPR